MLKGIEKDPHLLSRTREKKGEFIKWLSLGNSMYITLCNCSPFWVRWSCYIEFIPIDYLTILIPKHKYSKLRSLWILQIQMFSLHYMWFSTDNANITTVTLLTQKSSFQPVDNDPFGGWTTSFIQALLKTNGKQRYWHYNS